MRRERLLWIGGRESTRVSIIAALGRLGRLEFLDRPWLDSAGRVSPEELAGCALVVAEPRSPGEVQRLTRIVEQLQRGPAPVPCLALAPIYLPDDALALFRAGVSEYVESRIGDAELLRLVDRLAQDPTPVRSAPTACEVEQLVDCTTLTLPGISPAHKDQLRRTAGQDTPILLTGEPGTGKGRLAELIHEWSPRRDAPFVAINCAEHPGGDIELELFGAARGSFPGLDRDIDGKLALAGRGTILLERIEALPPALQSRLLRVIEDRNFEPIGAHEPLPLRARLIAASPVSLEDEVREGRFRADLYYRLNVVGFRLPPLRERRAAIQDLVFKFLADDAGEGDPNTITPEALRALEQHRWPGNIRELREAVAAAAGRSRGRAITADDLPRTLDAVEPVPAQAAPSPAPPDFSNGPEFSMLSRENAELARIMRALEQEQHNRMRTARALGISRVTLYKKLEKYGLLRKEGAVING